MKTLSKSILTVTAGLFALASAAPMLAVGMASADQVTREEAATVSPASREPCGIGCSIAVKSVGDDVPSAVFTVEH